MQGPRPNPPRRPKLAPGLYARWIDPLYKGRGKRRRRVRRGYYRIYADRSVRRYGWGSAYGYLLELKKNWGLSSADPIYRFNRYRDVINLDPKSPLYQCVWSDPLKHTRVQGNFDSGRVWYIVEDTNLERFYLYTRHSGPFQGGNAIMDTLALANEQLEKLRAGIQDQYSEESKSYMRLRAFVAWTAYEGTQGRGRMYHRRRRGAFTMEAGRGLVYDRNQRKYVVTLDVTDWERWALVSEAAKAARKAGRGRTPKEKKFMSQIVSSVAEYREYLRRQPPEVRKLIRKRLRDAVAEKYEALEAKRRKTLSAYRRRLRGL